MKGKVSYLIKCVVLSICISVIASCKNERKNVTSLKSIVDGALGEKLLLPGNLRLYRPFFDYIADSSKTSNSEFKLYSEVNTSCGTCINEINHWNKLSEEFRKYKVSIILVCRSDDGFELLRYFCGSGKIQEFPYPFFLDKKGEFSRLNKFMGKDDNLKTVLTDRDNTILLMGNPLRSKAMKDLYIKEIEKRSVKW